MNNSLKKTPDCWEDPRSYLVEDDEKNGKLHIQGSFFLHNTEFRFSMNQQTSGSVVMRGQVSLISPKTGLIMQYGGRKRTLKESNIKERRPEYWKNNEGKRITELNITTSVSSNSLIIDDLKIAISNAAARLYLENVNRINQEFGEVSRPDTITPIAAAYRYVDDYIRLNHKSSNKKACEKYRSSILAMYLQLPHIPMSIYQSSTIKSFLKSAKLSKQNEKLFRNFWEYCLQKGVYRGFNPLPPKPPKAFSPDIASRNAKRPDVLSLKEQKKAFELLLSEPNGGDTGFALMLWGGFSAKDSCNFLWKHVIFSPGHDDYVRIKYYRPDLAGATHDYTAPLFPSGGLILLKRYSLLRQKYSEDKLQNMPVVSQISNPNKAMRAEALVQHVTMRLHSIVSTYESLYTLPKNSSKKIILSKRLLHNTYENNVYYHCNLQNEEGTAKFLCRQSLRSNVTDDHYCCFSNEESSLHLHDYLSIMVPEKELDAPETNTKLLPNGMVENTYTPETTRQCIGFVNNYKLNPGEEIVIKCPHGVIGSIRTRGYNEDGTLRRKTQSKND